MSATSLNKQKKGNNNNLYVYKFGAGSKTPEYQPPTAAAVTKRIISSSVWGLRKSSKSKPKPGIDPDKVKELEGKGKGDIAEKERKWKETETRNGNGYGNGRRSVSSVEAILLSLASSGKGEVTRKSVSHSLNEGKGKEFPFPFPEEENCKGKMEGMRKSVSHSVNEGKEFPFPFPEEGNCKGKMEGTRKSVSHVGNNMGNGNGGKKMGMEKPRKSTGAKMESNVESAVAVLQVKVLVTDMPGFMQIHAFQCARITYDSLEIFSAKHLASNLKKEFDKTYGPAWHCIVGSSFGSFVTHATGCFLYFSMEKLCILLFRTKVQRAVQK